MILNILIVISKSLKPFLKKDFYDEFNLVEDMIIYNYIFFICSIMYYNYSNNKLINLVNKLNKKYIKIIIIYSLLTVLELYLSNIILKDNSVTKSKLIQKALYLIMTPIIGKYLFNDKIEKKNIYGIFFMFVSLLFFN